MQLLFVAISEEGQTVMDIKRIAGIVALLVIGYYVGTKYPAFWKQLAA